MVVLNESKPDTQEAVWVQRAHVVLHAQKNSLSIWWSIAQAVLEMEVFVFSSLQKHFLTWMPLILFWTNVSFYSPHHRKEFHSSTTHFMKNIHLDSLSLALTSFVRHPPIQTQRDHESLSSAFPAVFKGFGHLFPRLKRRITPYPHNFDLFIPLHTSSLILLFSLLKEQRRPHSV